MKNQLEKHLIMLKRSDMIDVWQDRRIVAGEEWDKAIKDELASADLILLLISVDFNNSQYIWKNELEFAMQRHHMGEARIIPIILRKCDWQDAAYARLQALPRNAKPITSYLDLDEAYTEVAAGIRAVVQQLSGSNL